LGSQCTSYLQQHKLVLTCVAWGADRKDAVLHRSIISVVYPEELVLRDISRLCETHSGWQICQKLRKNAPTVNLGVHQGIHEEIK
jgi:hypothetical protein